MNPSPNPEIVINTYQEKCDDITINPIVLLVFVKMPPLLAASSVSLLIWSGSL
jgi:hypothetical protein